MVPAGEAAVTTEAYVNPGYVVNRAGVRELLCGRGVVVSGNKTVGIAAGRQSSGYSLGLSLPVACFSRFWGAKTLR